MTKIIIQALEKTGQRGIINKGWGGLGSCESRFLRQTCHWYTIFAALIVKHVVISVSQWQNKRSPCIYWTTVRMIGCFPNALQW